MRLGGTVCCADMSAWEEALAASGFRAVTAPFSCETPRAERERLLEITEKRDVLIAEIGVWRNPFDAKAGQANLDYAKRQKWQKTIFAWFAKYLQDDPSLWDEMYPPVEL